MKLTVLGLTLESGQQLKQDILDDFTNTTGIQVDLIPTVGNSSEQLALVLKLLGRRATVPDVYVVDLIWPGILADHLLDLTPYLNAESRAHMPALLEYGTVGERRIALPFYMSAGALYYRADLLTRYGYNAPPRTWEELTRVAQRIQDVERANGRKNFWGFVWQGAAYEGLTCNALEWQASFGGGRIIDRDGTVAVNNAATVRALKTAAGWVGSISPPSVLSYTETDSQNLFRSGNVAFMRYWSSGFRSTAASMPAGSLGVVALPAGPAGRAQAVGGFHLGVSRYSRYPREAAAFVQHLTSVEVQTRRALKRGFLPTYLDVYRQPGFARALPESKAVLDAIPNEIVTRPSIISGLKYAEVSKAYHTTVHRILSGGIEAEAGLSQLESTLKTLLSTARQTGQE